jgi:Family of unknown function (DUF6518)
MATTATHRPTSPQPLRTPPRGLALAPLILVTGAVSLVLGQLTAYGQGRLPEQVASLANSSGPWVLSAFLLSLLARRTTDAALAGFASLALLLSGYIVSDWAHGYPSSHALIAFWGLAAVLVGPALGLAGYGVRRGTRTAAAWSIGAVTGILIGEGVYRLTFISTTTSPVYWWAELAVGLALLVTLIEARRLASIEALLAFGVAVITTGTFLLAYSQNLIAAF